MNCHNHPDVAATHTARMASQEKGPDGEYKEDVPLCEPCATRIETIGGSPITALVADDIAIPVDLLESLIDRDGCSFDHHGGCQAHGYLSLEPGEKCPQQAAKDLLAAHRGPS